jgi:hypothetical protein
MQTPDAAAGKKGRCVDCETVMIIPHPAPASGHWQDFDESRIFLVQQSTAATMRDGVDALRFNCLRCSKGLWLPADKTHKKVVCSGCGILMRLSNDAAVGTSLPGMGAEIRFQCPHCLKTVQVDSRLANQAGTCPECQAAINIPEFSKLVRASEPVPMAVDPLGLGSVGAMELLSEDPLMAGSWETSGGGKTLNWDGSQGGGRSYYRQQVRSGMPWEDDTISGYRFWSTVREVLLAPGEAYQRMKLEGGVGSPIGFAVSGMMLGGAALILYFMIFLIFQLRHDVNAGVYDSFPVNGYFTTIGIGSGVILAATSLGTLLVVYLLAAVHHLSLVLSQSTNTSLETTVRVVAYAVGSIGVTLIALPLFPLVLLISLPVSLKSGSEGAHGATPGQAMTALMISASMIGAFVIAVLVMFKAASG